MDSTKHCNTSSNSPAVPHEIVQAGEAAVRMYEKLLREGYGEKWAAMCALQKAPGVKGTDRSFMEGRYNNQQFDGMPSDHARNIITLARRAGINPTGKYYCAGLADHRGVQDPEAWVDGTGDIKRVAERRNLTVSGAVAHKGEAVPRPKSKPLSERLTREMMRVEKKNHPTMKKGELREMVIAKYGRKPK